MLIRIDYSEDWVRIWWPNIFGSGRELLQLVNQRLERFRDQALRRVPGKRYRWEPRNRDAALREIAANFVGNMLRLPDATNSGGALN